MSEKTKDVYLDLDAAGLPANVLTTARVQFDALAAARDALTKTKPYAAMEAARDALAKIAQAESARLRAAGKIPATHELALVPSRFPPYDPQVVIREMKSKKAKPAFDLS